jgi:hypothetical protein
MADENQNHDWQAAERDRLDRELDIALAKYAAAEPRAGLEERVLANLRTERRGVSDRVWWRWGVASAVALAAVVMVVALAWRSSMQPPPVIADHPSTATPRAEQPGPRVASNGAENGTSSPAHPPTTRRVVRRAHARAVAEAYPKLDQFPSPQPLSEQEKILVSYVEAYPDYAVVVARARTESLRRDELEETKAFPSSGWATDSDEPNNDKTNR